VPDNDNDDITNREVEDDDEIDDDLLPGITQAALE